jgi:hypothetical protein
VRLVSLGSVKDASALYLSDPENFRALWRKAMEHAVSWHDVEQPEPETVAQANVPDEPRARKQVTADMLVALAQRQVELFMSERGEPFARVPLNCGRANLMLRSKGFREWLGFQFWTQEHRVPSHDAMQAALELLAGSARFESGLQRSLAVRIAKDNDGSHWYDLGGPTWNAVQITAQGWQIVEEPPGLFRRHTATAEQPLPQHGGDLTALRDVLNLADDATWRLLVVWLAASFIPDIAHPVLHLRGEQGTAKSSAARTVCDLVDPSHAPLRGEPRDKPEWIQAADHGWMVTLDNVSKLPQWLSDAMCRAVTGDADTHRALFTDDDDVLIAFRRIVCLTSIEEVIEKSDLRDRTLLLPLQAITEERRQTESDMRARWTSLRPVMFGALLTLVAGVLRERPSVHLEKLPRMADFALIGVAVERVMHWKAGSFLDAYEDNQNAHHVAAMEADGLAALVLTFAQTELEWSGTPSDLLEALRAFESERDANRKGKHQSCLPKLPNQMTGRLSRSAPNLRAMGVTLESERTRSARNLTLRYTSPEPTGKPSSPSSPPTSPSQNGVTMPCEPSLFSPSQWSLDQQDCESGADELGMWDMEVGDSIGGEDPAVDREPLPALDPELEPYRGLIDAAERKQLPKGRFTLDIESRAAVADLGVYVLRQVKRIRQATRSQDTVAAQRELDLCLCAWKRSG